MESVSTRLNDETARLIRETADERGVSQAEVLRELVEKGIRYDDRVKELERENERLQQEKRIILNQREENTELVEYVEEQRSLERRRAEREEQRAQAGVLTRAKWWLTGMSDEQ